MSYSVRHVSRLLHQWGFTSQKPAFHAYEQSTKAVYKWVQQEYPRIKEMAQKQDGLILWLDETGLRSQHTSGKSFSPKGKTPVLKKSGKRFYINEIAAISNQGHFSFMAIDGNFNSEVFLRFLNKLIKSFTRKIFLITDAHPAHITKKVNNWFSAHQQKIEMFLLPGYSPELNPVEYFNQDLKTNMAGKARPRNKEQLKKSTEKFSIRKKKNPQQVKKYLLAKDVAYTK